MYTIYIHRLVAMAFIPNPNNYPQVNHKDGDKSNNNVSNLEWCNNQQNSIYARDNGLKPKVCKINMEIANKIRELYKTGEYSQKELGKRYRIKQNTISLIVRNKRWKI